MSIFGIALRGYGMLKKGKKISKTINSVKPKVNKTKLDKAKSEHAIAKAKAQGSGAKLKQTVSEVKNNEPLTFGKSFKKTIKNSDK